MTDLFIYNDKVESIFQLLGEKENNISYSVGYALANCKNFLENFLRHLDIPFSSQAEIKIKLQSHEKEKGFTDFEIIQESRFHIIIEAKRGWTFPGTEQIKKYATRLTFANSLAEDKKIIIFNESTPAFTSTHFNLDKINSISVQVISWNTISKLTMASLKAGRNSENLILRNLNSYLDKISTMQKIDSNWVYIVSLGSGNPKNWKISWKDIVNKRHRYFHPVGGTKSGWPTEPPNYIAFRYNGKLSSIHHIDKYEVFTDPSKHFSEAPCEGWNPHYLYHLGKAMTPNHEVKLGNIFRNGRVWAMIDLLLTSNSIEEARDKSKNREKQNE